jgi:YfiH family protein
VLGLEEVAFLEQVHGGEVIVCERGGCAGFADGLVTTTKGLMLMGKSGDCPIVLIADRRGRAVGFAHASWRATVAGITPTVVRQMAELGCEPGDLVACICPSAGPECYEVGDEVRAAALRGIGPHAEAFFHLAGWQQQAQLADGSLAESASRPAKYLLDLWSANTDALIRGGLGVGSIHTAGVCTLCRNDLFPSHRREGAACGRFAAVIGRPL